MAISKPLQNRVTPFGEIVSIPQLGMYTGNRGIIHNDQQQIVKPFVLKAWITCTLHYKNVRRTVMTGRKWTELFFLDEATAFAAGHRPCAFCRNADFKKFKALWLQANAKNFPLKDHSMKTIDGFLHRERMQLQKGHYPLVSLNSLPDGAMVCMENDTQHGFLWYRKMLFPWTIEGYGKPLENASVNQVFLITPMSIIAVFKNGYLPVIHQSLK